MPVDLYADTAHAKLFSGNKGGAGAKKGVENNSVLNAVELQAPLREIDRKAGGVIELLRLRPDGLIRDEPHIARASFVPAMSPSRDIRLVLEGDANAQAVEIDISIKREMENRFMIVVHEPAAVDRLEMTDRVIPDRHRLRPDDIILHNKRVPEGARDVHRD